MQSLDLSNEVELQMYDDVFDKKCTEYFVNDKDGKKIKIVVKNPEKHNSSHPLDQHPVIHFNKGWIIQNYDTKVVNPKSSNPKSILNRQKGRVVQYSKDNFIKSINMPGHDEEDVTSVFVLYDEDNSDNYTLTHRITVK